MDSTLQSSPGSRRSPWKVVVATLLLSLAALAGVFWLMMESMGVIIAYVPTEIPIQPSARLKDARDRLALKGDEYTRWIHLAEVAHWTVDTGDLTGALELAEEALAMAPKYSRDWNYGNVIHKANLTRGRVALRIGQPKAAATFLRAAGRTPGSPQLDSFGPSMLLAREMLAAGEREAVLEYIDLVGRFWERDRHARWAWKRLIADGRTPNFGVHLAL